MATAARLLATTDWHVTEIAKLSGYATVEHFIHTFKKFNGVTGTAYRAKFTEQERGSLSGDRDQPSNAPE